MRDSVSLGNDDLGLNRTFTYSPGALVSTSRFLCRPHGVAVDLHGVVRAQRVAPGERDRYRDARVPRTLKDHLVPTAQPFERESQTAELVEPVWIRSRQIEHELGTVPGEDLRQALLEERQILGVSGSILQPDVQVARRLPHRVVVLLVPREGEDIGIALENRGR